MSPPGFDLRLAFAFDAPIVRAQVAPLEVPQEEADVALSNYDIVALTCAVIVVGVSVARLFQV